MTVTHADLRIVNAKVNLLPYKLDIERYKTPEFWEEIEDEGDCEDYMIAKIQRLKALGLPISAMRIVTCFVKPYQTREEKAKRGHAVLAVDLDDKTYFLDIGNDIPIDSDLYPHELHKIQTGACRFEWAEGADRSFQ